MASSNSKTDPLRVFFLPYLMAGHMIPMVDIARLFATHGGGVHVTIVTTPANALVFRDAVARADCRRSGGRIRIHTLSLPPGSDVENLSAASTEESFAALAQAIVGLREPAERLLREELPDCVVSDMFYPWTADVAAELGIPRLLFNGSGYFHLCASRSEVIVESGAGSVLLSGLPDRVTMLRSQIPDWTPMRSELRDALKEAEEKSYGAVMNSFEEMEPAYVAHFRSTVGMKEWSVGPVSLWANRDSADKSERGKIVQVEESVEGEILKWLDSKEDESVVYVCFGSLTRFGAAQLEEISRALESCGHPYIWVVRRRESEEQEPPLPPPSPSSSERRGFVVREWAPQVVILEHPAVGGMVTHCGWNSVAECVASGVPMATWPLFAEQFYNEKLVTEILGVGVGVGVREWNFGWWRLGDKEIVGRGDIEKAVRVLMGGGEEAVEMRRRARRLADEAKKAVESGGSSRTNFMALIDELKSLKSC